MKKENILFETLTIFTEKLTSFHTLIESTDCQCPNGLPLEKIKNDIPNVLKMINKFNNVKSLTLIEQEYINFCLLLAFGNEMADFLLKLKKCPEKSLVHARSWKEIAKNFIPFLNEQSKPLVNS